MGPFLQWAKGRGLIGPCGKQALRVSKKFSLSICLNFYLFILVAPGKNVINRNAIESNVTLSHTYTFQELKSGQSANAESEYCSCGWPEHMLVPKGTTKGMDFELFVMATDYSVDNVRFLLFFLLLL